MREQTIQIMSQNNIQITSYLVNLKFYVNIARRQKSVRPRVAVVSMYNVRSMWFMEYLIIR